MIGVEIILRVRARVRIVQFYLVYYIWDFFSAGFSFRTSSFQEMPSIGCRNLWFHKISIIMHSYCDLICIKGICMDSLRLRPLRLLSHAAVCMLSVNPGSVKHLQSHTASRDSVLIQFYSPRHDYVFQYSMNVSCSPGEFTSVRFTCGICLFPLLQWVSKSDCFSIVRYNEHYRIFVLRNNFASRFGG